eukprot:TRINITY_DN62614_c0_g1_i1.p1 TRINITY_DN62614_c0_g1~~TRINITY_DN62614_c0_g1_i1.p1  ORF type:complete len:337 (+),score=35.21 TRINITY_DN62614_c0_g1_i1:80-1012(+)
MAVQEGDGGREVLTTRRPPRRLEGGGFTVCDIFSGLAPARCDPFLMWHELPRHHYNPGEMPGAPLHPHRGFFECPYCKEMTADGGVEGGMNVRVVAGGATKRGRVDPGDFELGKVGIGMEHEGLIDSRWSGHLHMFQLWVNLPAANKFDPPFFQNASSAVLPIVTLSKEPSVTAKVLHGEIDGYRSPTECDVVDWQYLDFEMEGGASVTHVPPQAMRTSFVYCYRGAGSFCGTAVGEGLLAVLSAEGPVDVTAQESGCGFLFIAGRPIGEPVFQHGPFVMTTPQQIQECFRDYQAGKLCPNPVTYTTYEE